MNAHLDVEFYFRHTADVARALIGMRLVRTVIRKGFVRRLSGIIVETEAYGARDDPASHARMGRTKRNSVMFGEPGRAYVYFTYGTHYCVNVTARLPEAEAGAVLLRAIEPIDGIEVMISNRSQQNPRGLASGPGRLTQALQIGAKLNGTDMTGLDSELRIELGETPDRVVATTRVGISKGKEKKWRFIDPSSSFLSGPAIKIR